MPASIVQCGTALKLALLGGILLLARVATAQPDRPPNIVFILTDDQGYGDAACYGSETLRTPSLDRMAREGMRFTACYTASSVCSPTRAAILTGREPPRAGVSHVFHFYREGGLDRSEITVAEVLRDRGYATAAIGKWHLGHTSPYLPERRGFDWFYGIPYSNNMGPAADMDLAADARFNAGLSRADAEHYLSLMRGVRNGADWRRLRPRNGAEVPLMEHDQIVAYPVYQDKMTADFTQAALDFIDRNVDRPFFVYLAHPMPHTPLHPGTAFAGRSPHGTYADVIEELDWSVGRILDHLQKRGLAENTLVLFTSDNGPAVGSAGLFRGSKGTSWEGGHRVPLLVWWPEQVPAGIVTDHAITSTDFFPTLAGLASALLPADRRFDGRNLSELLRNPAAEIVSREIYYHSPGFLGAEAIRIGNLKLRIPRHDKEGNSEGAPIQLYDLAADPGESRNLAAKRPNDVTELRCALNAFNSQFSDNPP